MFAGLMIRRAALVRRVENLLLRNPALNYIPTSVSRELRDPTLFGSGHILTVYGFHTAVKTHEQTRTKQKSKRRCLYQKTRTDHKLSSLRAMNVTRS